MLNYALSGLLFGLLWVGLKSLLDWELPIRVYPDGGADIFRLTPVILCVVFAVPIGALMEWRRRARDRRLARARPRPSPRPGRSIGAPPRS